MTAVTDSSIKNRADLNGIITGKDVQAVLETTAREHRSRKEATSNAAAKQSKIPQSTQRSSDR